MTRLLIRINRRSIKWEQNQAGLERSLGGNWDAAVSMGTENGRPGMLWEQNESDKNIKNPRLFLVCFTQYNTVFIHDVLTQLPKLQRILDS